MLCLYAEPALRCRGGRRPTPPATGTHLFVAGLNFITNERVRPAAAAACLGIVLAALPSAAC